ncbi:MAG: MoaD/ThiS family protein [Desulfuromonadales bacterium]
MSSQSVTTVRMFGALHTYRREQGLETKIEVNIPPDGYTAGGLARELGLPLEKIEAVFINHRACGLNRIIRTGDRVAFVPTGIPGTERLLLGFYGICG